MSPERDDMKTDKCAELKGQFARFKGFAAALFAVPKSECDQQSAEYELKKAARLKDKRLSRPRAGPADHT
jgi:hypothetical protein